MASPPEYAQDLIVQGKLHEERIANLRNDTDTLQKKAELSKDELAAHRNEVGILKQ